MKTTSILLNAVQAATGATSDYKLAPILGLTRAALSNYRNEKRVFDDKTALKIAQILEIPSYFVLCACAAERAADDETKAAFDALLDMLTDEKIAALLRNNNKLKPLKLSKFQQQCILC